MTNHLPTHFLTISHKQARALRSGGLKHTVLRPRPNLSQTAWLNRFEKSRKSYGVANLCTNLP